MKRAQILICALFVLSETGRAQQTYFNNTYDYQNELQFAFDVFQLTDSSYVMLNGSLNLATGENPFQFTFVDKNGVLINQKTFLKPLHVYYIGMPGSLKKTLDGGYAFGGSVEPGASGDGSDFLFVKLSASFDTLYTRTFSIADFDIAYDCYQTTDSGYVLLGIAGTSSMDQDWLLIRLDSLGNYKWHKIFGDTGTDYGFNVFETPSKHLILSGIKNLTANSETTWIIKLDSEGNLIDEKEFNYQPYLCETARLTFMNSYYLMIGCLDTIYDINDIQPPAYIAKLDTNFNILWRTDFHGSTYVAIRTAKELQDSSIVFVGTKDSPTFGTELGWIVKLDQDGYVVWEHVYYYAENVPNYLVDFQQTFDKGFIATGTSFENSNQDVWLVKLDSMGCLQPNCITNIGTIEVGHDAFELQVYPNPATSQATVLYNLPYQTKEATLQVFDVTGRLIRQIPLTKNANSIALEVSEWSGGIYLCNLIADSERVQSVKLVKQ